jgi:Domain of unknown function (DUF4129)
MLQSPITHHHELACIVVFLIIVLFFCPASVSALPIAEYQKNLQQAITALDTLNQSDEDESTTDFENRFNQTIEAVRAALPEHQTIESGTEVYNVDNSWLHKELNELNQASNPLDNIKQILATLQALQTRVAEGQNPGTQMDSKDQAKTKLDTILARPEYTTGAKGTNALMRLIQDFTRWLEKLFPKRRTVDPNRASWISFIAQIAVVGGAGLLVIYIIRILLNRFGRSRKHKTRKSREPRIVLGEKLEPDATATDLLAEAETLARRGDLRAAIRKAYIALLVELGDRKLISLAHYKTNRDYLNSLRAEPQLHSRMTGLTNSFERHWYGFADATSNDWEDFRAGYVATLRSRN